jgi:hypothetical protein
MFPYQPTESPRFCKYFHFSLSFDLVLVHFLFELSDERFIPPDIGLDRSERDTHVDQAMPMDLDDKDQRLILWKLKLNRFIERLLQV